MPAAALGGVLLFIAQRIFHLGAFADILRRAPAEFALALPEDQRWSAGRAKRVLRNGLADLMPAAILSRDDKGNGSQAQFAELVHLHDAGAFAHLQLASIGMVDAAEVEPMYRAMCGLFARGDRHYVINASQLWLLFCAEAAWRALFGETPGVERAMLAAEYAGMA